MNRRDFLVMTLGGAAAASLPAAAWASSAAAPSPGELRAWSEGGLRLSLWPEARRVVCYDAQGGERWRLENPAGAADGLHYPVAAAFDEARGRVYVSDRGLGAVWALSLGGERLALLGQGQLSAPRGVAVGPDGALYVADAGQHVVWRLGVSGQWAALGGFGVDAEGLNGPVAVALDPQGVLHVADMGNRRVQRLDARSGACVGAYAEGVAARSLALDGAGRAWVAELETLRCYDARGALLGESALEAPVSLSVASGGRLWRSDWS